MLVQDQYESTKPKQINPVGQQTNSQENSVSETESTQNIQSENDSVENQNQPITNDSQHTESAPTESPENDIELEDASDLNQTESSEVPSPEPAEEIPSPTPQSETKSESGWPHAEEVQKEQQVNEETVESIQEEAAKKEENIQTPTSEIIIEKKEEIQTTEDPSTQPEIDPNPTPIAAKQTAPEANDDLSDDEEILKFIEETKQKIYIVGSGGSGSNTLDRLFELGTTGSSLLAMNTDARHLLKTRANKKIIIGKKISRGRGAGSNPAIGEKAAKESVEDIKEALNDASLVFITCGLGGGTGTGSAPVIAEIAKSMGALTVAVVTLPFLSEGKIRMENALEGLDRLKKHTDTLIVIKNDRLLNLVPDLPLNTAFKVCDEVLAGSVKGIAELVTKSGLVNVDFADLRTILSGAGFAAIGLGEASLDAKQEDRARVAVETALSSPLLDADISSSTRALINVIGGEDMTLKEAEFIVAETSRRINQNAHIIWGSRVEENIKKSSMRVLVVLAGVKFPKYEFKEKEAEVEDLDLDLIG
jgi:cell division protein FtsZ